MNTTITKKQFIIHLKESYFRGYLATIRDQYECIKCFWTVGNFDALVRHIRSDCKIKKKTYVSGRPMYLHPIGERQYIAKDDF